MHENQRNEGANQFPGFIPTFVNYIRESYPEQQKENDADTQQYIDNGMFSL